MKKHFIFPALIAVALFSCNQHKTNNIESNSTLLTYQDSLYSLHIENTLFSSPDLKLDTALAVLNTSTAQFCTKITDTFKKDAWDNKEYLEGRPGYELYIQDSVFLAEKTLISLRYTTYTFLGGAHGMTGFTAINYNPQTHTFLQNKDLFRPESTTAINELLAQNFNNPDSCFWDKPTLEQVSAINIGKDSVTFIYSQYTLGAYACGPAEVNIPVAEFVPYTLIPLPIKK